MAGAEKTKSALQEQTENLLGRELREDEWDEVSKMAERKLRGIISREGDEGGKRTETWYLAQLAAEIARSEQLSKFTQFINFCGWMQGERKSPCDKHTSIRCNPYCIMAQDKMQ